MLRIRQRLLDGGGEVELRERLRQRDWEGEPVLAWFTPAGLQALGIDAAEVDPGWVMEPDTGEGERWWDDEYQQALLGKCHRPAGAPALEPLAPTAPGAQR